MPKTEEWAGLLLVAVAAVFVTAAIVFGSWWFVLWGIPAVFILPYVLLWGIPRLPGAWKAVQPHLRVSFRSQKALKRRAHIAFLEAELGVPVAMAGRCGACGGSLPAGAKFCTYCGARTVVIAHLCPECKTRLPEDGKYCPGCGILVGTITSAAHTRDTLLPRRPVHPDTSHDASGTTA